MDSSHSRKSRRPSATMIVAAVALTLALTGSAIAMPSASTRAVTKSTVKKIAKSQADKVVTSRAPGLSVAKAATADSATSAGSATNATNATNAGNLGGVPAAQYVRGVEIVLEETAFTSADKDVNANCPAGKQVIGGGAQINTQDTSIALQASRPSLNGLHWDTRAVEVNPTAVNWQLAAYAICAVVG